MGLLDYNLDTPEGQGLLSAAFSLLGAQKMPGQRGSMGPALADAGRQYMGTSESARNAALQRKLTQAQIDENDYQNRARAAALAAAERKRAALPGLYGRGGSLTSPGIGIDPAQGGQGANIDYMAALQAGYTPDEIQKLSTLPNAGRAEVARTVEVMENGRPVTRQLDKFGQLIGEGLGVYKAPVFQNLGGRTVAIDPVTMREAGSFSQSMSPSERDASARGWAGVNLQREQASLGKRHYDPERGGVINLQTGEFTPATQNGAVIGPKNKIGEAGKKQIVGIDALGGAIDEYVKELSEFGLTSLSSPDKRASMGTKYNNMMLQAKEAYNLGVLNGPDLAILTSVVTDPVSAKGAFTSNKALANQAKELKRLMGKVRESVAAQGVRQSGVTGSFDQPDSDPLGIRK